MSAPATVVQPTTVSESTQQPPAGTHELTGAEASSGAPVVFAVTDPNTSVSNPVAFEVTNDFITELANLGNTLTIALATAGAVVTLSAPAGAEPSTSQIVITASFDSAGNALEMGGMIVKADQVNGLTVSLVGANASVTIPSETLVAQFPIFARLLNFTAPAANLSNALASAGKSADGAALNTSALNTAIQLSRGNDSYIGSQFNDGVFLSQGADVAVGGGGDDLFAAIATIKNAKTTITMDGSGDNAGSGGKDTLLMAKEALAKGKASITLTDFTSKSDKLAIEAKPKSISGYNSNKLKITTKDKKTITIKSEAGKFKASDIEFI